MDEMVFAIIMLVGAVIGLGGLGFMVFSPPTAQKLFLAAGLTGMLGFLGYAVTRVRVERQQKAAGSPNPGKKS